MGKPKGQKVDSVPSEPGKRKTKRFSAPTDGATEQEGHKLMRPFHPPLTFKGPKNEPNSRVPPKTTEAPTAHPARLVSRDHTLLRPSVWWTTAEARRKNRGGPDAGDRDSWKSN